ncbi:MAG: hypothetical protein LBU89_10595 [Fibromonadaceae bacterium]|jgi:hypothetical protein|nr:hypothetical protein [Fibromonadaceae bacterium]
MSKSKLIPIVIVAFVNVTFIFSCSGSDVPDLPPPSSSSHVSSSSVSEDKQSSSSSSHASSSSVNEGKQSSSSFTPETCIAKEDVPKYCGEVSWDNIKWNTMPDALGGCFYVFNLTSISTNTTYIVNGNVHLAGTKTDFGPKVDGGYYIFLQSGSLSDVNAVLGVKPACETGAYGLVCTTPTALPTGVEGIPITVQRPTPTLACNNGFEPTDENINWPNWTNPAAGEHNIIATANCGPMVLQGSCGTMKIDPVTLTCGTMPNGVEGIAINQRPILTCNNGFNATAPVYNGINWDNPAVGEHSVEVTANCGSVVLQGSCGTMKIDPVTLTCGTVPSNGIEGIAIPANQWPTLACNNGFNATSPVYNGIDWDNPIPGNYDNTIKATANCGQKLGLQANCSGILTIAPVTLTCGTVPPNGIEGIAIPANQRPTLTCNNGSSATSPVYNGINWDNPALGVYEDGSISVTATCGAKFGLQANCSGVLNVSSEPFCDAFPLLDDFCPGIDWADIKWNQAPPSAIGTGCYYVENLTSFYVAYWNQTLFKLNGSTLTTQVHNGNIGSYLKVDGGYYIYFNNTSASNYPAIYVTVGTSKPSCAM